MCTHTFRRIRMLLRASEQASNMPHYDGVHLHHLSSVLSVFRSKRTHTCAVRHTYFHTSNGHVKLNMLLTRNVQSRAHNVKYKRAAAVVLLLQFIFLLLLIRFVFRHAKCGHLRQLSLSDTSDEPQHFQFYSHSCILYELCYAYQNSVSSRKKTTTTNFCLPIHYLKGWDSKKQILNLVCRFCMPIK